MTDQSIPQELRYTDKHEWIALDGDQAKIGITEYAQDALGDVVFVSLPTVGDTLETGDSCGEVESTKSVSEIYAPLSGEVVAVNDALEQAPETINSDPYGEGWMFTVKLGDPAQVDGLLDADGYRALLG